MIVRIVEMQVKATDIAIAQDLIKKVSTKVRSMPGCQRLEILNDIHHAGHFSTYSYWATELDLNVYRNSETFIDFWSKIKPLFERPARAWSSQIEICLV